MGQIEKYKVVRGDNSCKDPGKAKNYSGVTYRNTFQVTGGPIYLTSVNFFGPCTADSDPATVEYDVRVTVEPSLGVSSNKRIHRIAEVTAKVQASRHQLWTVQFNPPVRIPPNDYFDIAFFLRNGSTKTGYLDVKKVKTDFTFQTQDGERVLHFFEGSGQMHSIEFQVLDAAPSTSVIMPSSRMVGFETTSFGARESLFDRNA